MRTCGESLFRTDECCYYESVFNFLLKGRYPVGFSKDQKRSFRRKARGNYKVEGGVLYYAKSCCNTVKKKGPRGVRFEGCYSPGSVMATHKGVELTSWGVGRLR